MLASIPEDKIQREADLLKFLLLRQRELHGGPDGVAAGEPQEAPPEPVSFLDPVLTCHPDRPFLFLLKKYITLPPTVFK